MKPTETKAEVETKLTRRDDAESVLESFIGDIGKVRFKASGDVLNRDSKPSNGIDRCCGVLLFLVIEAARSLNDIVLKMVYLLILRRKTGKNRK